MSAERRESETLAPESSTANGAPAVTDKLPVSFRACPCRALEMTQGKTSLASPSSQPARLQARPRLPGVALGKQSLTSGDVTVDQNRCFLFLKITSGREMSTELWSTPGTRGQSSRAPLTFESSE